MKYTLKNLPKKIKNQIMKSYYLSNTEDYETHKKNKSTVGFKSQQIADDLFSQLLDNDSESSENNTQFVSEIIENQVFWGTNNYENKGADYSENSYVNDLSIIVPRVEKSQMEQKRRVKEKAEVFTPSWICNVQNNLVDDDLLGKNAFNKSYDDDRKWNPRKEKVNFDNYSGTWFDYVQERRLEMACGEAPYMMSPYDTTTGAIIPVRDDNGLFQRVGTLDRKLRIVTENASSELWNATAMVALSNTFGYEWQGDNVLLARLNFLNTYIEYYEDALGAEPIDEDILLVAELASWNIWQMDGLKMVQPNSCLENCKSCIKKSKTGHNGRLSVCRFITSQGFEQKVFDNFLNNN